MKKIALFALIFGILVMGIIGILLVLNVIASDEARDLSIKLVSVIAILTVVFLAIWQSAKSLGSNK
ncbi:MAG: hypothetical protein WCO55_02380 [Candidatus Falkowbacteria bacterium]